MDVLIQIWTGLMQSNNLLIVGSTLTVALIFIAWKLSLLGPSKPTKQEKYDDALLDSRIDLVGNLTDAYEKQIKALVDRMDERDRQTAMRERQTDAWQTKMNETIHNQQVKLTRLQVLVMQMNGLLIANGVQIPDYMKEEFDQLIEGDS